jgi:ferrous iron transport protein B
MSCSARLPVYVIIGAAFFGARAGTLVFGLYALGIVVAVLIGLLFKNTLFRRKEQAAFVMELPPYRVPALTGVLIHTWEHTWAFIRKAWTVILAASVIIWLLLSIPVGAPQGARFADVDAGHSALATISRGIAPVFAPAGYGRWEAATALVTGVLAKEVVISTLSQVYLGNGETAIQPAPTTFWQDLGAIALSFLQATWDTIRGTISIIPGVNLFGPDEAEATDPQLGAALQRTFTPLAAVAFCVFVLLYTPCTVTLTALWHEYGPRWALFSAGYMLALAWLVSTVVYQGGRLLGFGA